MKSPFTGKDMILVREKRTQTFRKEEFEITHHSFRCVDTEEQFTNTELDVLNLTQLYNQYREKHKIPFPEQIKQIREKYKVSAAKMADILGFGVNSYRLYEDGEIPSLSNARLIQSVDEPDVFKQMVNLCDKLDKNEGLIPFRRPLTRPFGNPSLRRISQSSLISNFSTHFHQRPLKTVFSREFGQFVLPQCPDTFF